MTRPAGGPRTPEGKAISCRNSLKHGLTGHFELLNFEDPARYQMILDGLREEHNPATITENMLVEKMAQHFWLSQRAQMMADMSMDPDREHIDHEKQFALFLRYQNQNDRAFHKCLDQLLKLRAEQRKAKLEEAKFVSQKAKDVETEAKVRLVNAKTEALERKTNSKSEVQSPLPGYEQTPVTLQNCSIAQKRARIRAASEATRGEWFFHNPATGRRL